MYVIIDWQTQSLIVHEGTDTIQTFDSSESAFAFAEAELHTGLWSVVEVPSTARIYI